MIQLQEPRKTGPFALFNLGFRPFFLLGALSAAVMMLYWLVSYSNGTQPPYYGYGVYWHGHEMLLGYTFAIISGFLLTAARTWTSVQTPFGKSLIALTVLWLLGRLLPFVPATPHWLIAAVDLAFSPVVAVALAIPILKSRNYRNLVFIPILAAFFLANLLVHLELLGVTESTAINGLHLALYLTAMVIAILGGRVIPFFTERGLGQVSCTRFPLIEKAVIPVTVIWLVAQFTHWNSLMVVTGALAAAVHWIRLAGWFHARLFKVPLVWILHLGYAFLALGFSLSALAAASLLSGSIAIHAFAAGAIGCLTLGMMARVSLGHTARPLEVTPVVLVAFLLMFAAAAVRVSISWLPLPYLTGLHLAGTLWSLAWILFLVRYSAILIRPRKDGLYG
ncbi:NnrS family protein [Marinobacterium jannaschii]|uniref:NnrS family protein n=1 Tax=Marinobacterium jannaschii TaxID=64970 RepID=UPI0004891A8E|nr:NnrS family protein [Marinobacterium jannaschii]